VENPIVMDKADAATANSDEEKDEDEDEDEDEIEDGDKKEAVQKLNSAKDESKAKTKKSKKGKKTRGAQDDDGKMRVFPQARLKTCISIAVVSGVFVRVRSALFLIRVSCRSAGATSGTTRMATFFPC